MKLNRTFSLSKLSVGQRLLSQTLVMALTLVVIGSLAFFALTYARNSSEKLHNQVNETSRLTHLINTLQEGMVETINSLNTGVVTWADADAKLALARKQFESDWQALSASTTSQGGEQQSGFTDMQRTVAGVFSAFDQFKAMGGNQSRADLELFLLNDLSEFIGPFNDASTAYADQLTQQAQVAFETSEGVLNIALIAGSAIILLSLGGAIGLSQYIRRSILRPVNVIAETVDKVKQGDSEARTALTGTDELVTLGQALDQLLNEKVATLIRIERENEVLNNSVIELLEGTSKLSDRDLTTKLTVREDITGPVADALNLVTKETSEALGKIRYVSNLVSASSVMVDEQTRKVVGVADQERKLIEQTIQKLDGVAKHMAQIAKWCQSCNQIAQSASSSTDKAYEAVGNTVESMDEIRDSISETEKRIKRLSERSLEISGIIDIINSIAERTHVLALNASMQAAAAGEAGRGFAVVADEVQRLAESSRNATSQISSLIRNIQTETADAVDTMNNSITQVVNGSKRATQAGSQMQETQKTTRELVTAVEKIAQNSLAQAKETQSVCQQTGEIEASTRVTDMELKRQSLHTERLRTASGVLQQTVELFTLPASVSTNIRIPELSTESLETSASAPSKLMIPSAGAPAKEEPGRLKQAS
ncbi:HAMP domain-containing protein [Hahella sp. KA22]|uniref:methyl-accepting chemotaxis protein n=1 Tax=Hahella sp. KA22 TaxID=1628392 RepID=UPI000FDF5A55|nr:HAMP domain-containing methyl-accepting chemotaxis protein [Hahella sp. KA22]AZZ90544.1 methyl-accepting chemotaxis protein [Hahella sp. KA22]QAY53914.1 HAMP domain-containing protein [Hahella sp. KA22]